MKNCYDLFKIAVGIAYFAFCFTPDYAYRMKFFFDDIDLQNYQTTSQQSLSFSILIFLQWVQLIEHLRFSAKIRIFMEVIRVTIIDVVPFLILLVLGLLAVMDFLFFKRFMVTGKSRDDNYVRMFVKYFRIFFFADFMEEIDSYDGVEVSMFAFAAITILIILMNLLISIIGDSHEKVYSTKKSTEDFIRCYYIIGLESINVFPCCNRFDSDGFLVCAEYENQKGVEEWEGRVTEIGRKIDKQSETTK